MLDADEIQGGEGHAAQDRDRFQMQACQVDTERFLDDQFDEDGHADDGKGALQGQRKPVGQPAEQAEHGPKTSFDVEVGPAGSRHGSGQFGFAQHAGNNQQGRQQIGDNDRWSRLGVGQRRQDEQPRTDHGAGSHSKNVQRPELFLQLCQSRLSLAASFSRWDRTIDPFPLAAIL